MNIVKAKMIGFGACLPNEPIGNDYFASYLDTTDEWIKTRSGIETRHLITTQTLSDLTYIALEEALKNANLGSQDIDLIIVATTTADNNFPSCATKLHGLFQMKETTQALDIGAACNGFIYGLELVKLFIALPHIKNIALIGADIMSNLLNKNDRSTAVLFGDGASCVIFQKTDEEKGFIGQNFGTDGSGFDLLYTKHEDGKQIIVMNGKEIFTRAIKKMSESIKKSLQSANLSLNDIDLLIPHQANMRIIDMIGEQLQFPANKIMKTIKKQGNTSAASIPLATYQAWKEGKLNSAAHICFCGFGWFKLGKCDIKDIVMFSEEQIQQFADFILIEKNLTQNTYLSYLNDINQFKKFANPKKTIQENLQKYIIFLKKEKINHTTIARKFSALKQFLNFHDIEFNIKLPKISQPLKLVNYKEVFKLLNSIEDLKHKAFLYLLFATGARVSETLSIKISDILPCLKNDQLYFQLIGKGRKERTVFITHNTLSVLKEYILILDKKQKFLFEANKAHLQQNKPLSRQWAHKLITTLSAKLNLTHLHPHAFRHAQAMMLLDSGADLIAIKELLGHASLNSTQRYLQLHWKHLEDAISLHPLNKN